MSSRLLIYEVWNRVHNLGLGDHLAEAIDDLFAEFHWVELAPLALERVLRPFPLPVRTLDALHLATADYLRSLRSGIRVATYDERMAEAGRKMGLDLYPL